MAISSASAVYGSPTQVIFASKSSIIRAALLLIGQPQRFFDLKQRTERSRVANSRICTDYVIARSYLISIDSSVPERLVTDRFSETMFSFLGGALTSMNSCRVQVSRQTLASRH